MGLVSPVAAYTVLPLAYTPYTVVLPQPGFLLAIGVLVNAPTDRLVSGTPTVGVPATGAVEAVALAGAAETTPRPTARSAHDNRLASDLAKGMRLADIKVGPSIRVFGTKVPPSQADINELGKPAKAFVERSSPVRGHSITWSKPVITERYDNFTS